MSDYDWSEWLSSNEDGLPVFKFDEVGDQVTGALTALETAQTKFGPRPKLTILLDDDTEVVVFAGGSALQSALAEKNPQVGCRVQITHTGTKDTGKGNPLKLYEVKVARPKASEEPM